MLTVITAEQPTGCSRNTRGRVRVILFSSEKTHTFTSKGKKSSQFFVSYFSCLIFSLLCILSVLTSLWPPVIDALLIHCQFSRCGPEGKGSSTRTQTSPGRTSPGARGGGGPVLPSVCDL